jgi:sterol desaturase/sphingolipid hydroxylase (fatty acid hydroxylase superfamily)
MLTQPTSPFDLHMRMIVLATALGFMALEYALARLAHRDSHDLRESAASFGVAIGQSLIRVLEALGMAMPFAFAYRHRLFDFDQTSALTLLGLFVGSEFLYYWHHRASHRLRWLWATHSVHHSPTKLNLTAAIRLGWTGSISGSFLFFLPLAWIGFHPLMIVGMLSVNLLYQFFIHTEFSPRLGPLEWVLNTPGHHRVHHASNDTCLDKNYGGILIVFDRLFGTFTQAPSSEQLRYGLAGRTPTFNPFRIALGEWAAMFRDVRVATTWRDRISVLFAPPGARQNTKPTSGSGRVAPVSTLVTQVPGE